MLGGMHQGMGVAMQLTHHVLEILADRELAAGLDDVGPFGGHE